MDVNNSKKVFIIFDRDKFTQSIILDELKSEGFPYFFKTMDTVEDDEVLCYYIEQSDEVWLFGEVECELAYRLANEKGCDIWQMS